MVIAEAAQNMREQLHTLDVSLSIRVGDQPAETLPMRVVFRTDLDAMPSNHEIPGTRVEILDMRTLRSEGLPGDLVSDVLLRHAWPLIQREIVLSRAFGAQNEHA